MQGHIKFSIDSDLQNVSLVGKSVSGICSLRNFSEIEIYAIELSVVEAVNNVIEHAYEGTSGHIIDVVVSMLPSKIVMHICDTGKPMHPSYLAEDDLTPLFYHDDLESLPESGMGLAIIQQVMDKVEYRSFKGKNVLTLTKVCIPNPDE